MDKKIITHPLYNPKLSPWLDVKVFYIRVTNCKVDELFPRHLTLNHIPLTPNTVLEMNGKRSSIYSECVSLSSVLRRDRMDKRSEEATFVSTDSIRTTGSMRFEVSAKNEMLLSGVLGLSNANGETRWTMKFSSCILKGKHEIEVYVAGCFIGSPIILTRTLQIGVQKKNPLKVMLDSIPENEPTEQKNEVLSKDTFQLSEYRDFTPEHDVDIDYRSLCYSRVKYLEGDEDGELSWFNAGVRVGVGLGLGICLGVGLGAGLLVRTYQAATRNFKKRLN